MVQTASFETRESRSLLQRFVRTDFYLDPTLYSASKGAVWVHNFSAVWLNDANTINALNEDYRAIYDALSPADVGLAAETTTMNNTIGCLAALFRGGQATPSQMSEYARAFSEIRTDNVEAEQQIAVELLSQNIVIERSPPIAQALSSLLHGATSISLGALVGMNMTDNPYLMMITIPAGVIVKGTALGVSRGLQQGLQKRVEKLVNPPKRRL
jgi:hypothetical protein